MSSHTKSKSEDKGDHKGPEGKMRFLEWERNDPVIEGQRTVIMNEPG